MLTDTNDVLVDLSRHFTCMKFGETDEGNRYYRAAGYFLPQWYWQPIFCICYPDGREMEAYWRHTHEVVRTEELARILRAALERHKPGLDPKLVAANRTLLKKAAEALETDETDQALALARKVKEAVGRGWVRRDAEALEREALFLASVKKRIETYQAVEEASDDLDGLLNGLNLAAARGYAEALATVEPVASKKGALAGAAAALRSELLAVLRDNLEVSRVSLGRYRFGPVVYHDLRAQVRSRLDAVEKLTLQYYVQLRNGRVCAAFEEHCDVDRADHLRASTLLPYLEVPDPRDIEDIRVELWLGRHRIDARHMSLSPSSPPWWETDRVTVLILDTHRGSTWNGEGFRKSGHTGVSWQRKVTVENPPAVKSEALDELKRVYEVFDNRRFSFAARAARYRAAALGTAGLPYIKILAYRYGAVTTLQLLPALARIPHRDAAGQLIHVMGADDVTLRYPAYRSVSWLESQEYVPIYELLRYLEGDDDRLAEMAAATLGVVGHIDGYLPLLAYLRSSKAGSRRARTAVRAMESIAGRTFGLTPDKELKKQPAAVRALYGWWKKQGEASRRVVWMAVAVEETGMVPKGKLERAVQANDQETLARLLGKLLKSGDRATVRRALVMAKLCRVRALAPAVFELFAAMDRGDKNLVLARNALRDLMTVAVLGRCIGLLEGGSKRSTVLDLLLTATGEWRLYPPRGTRLDDQGWAAQHAKWRAWYDRFQGKLRWSEAEGRFVKSS